MKYSTLSLYKPHFYKMDYMAEGKMETKVNSALYL